MNSDELLRRRVRRVIRGALGSRQDVFTRHKNSLLYVREFSDVAWLIEGQVSRYDEEGVLRFTLNSGIYVRGVMSSYGGGEWEEPSTPKFEYCCVSWRVGLMESGFDDWWSVSAEDTLHSESDVATTNAVNCLFHERLFPMLNRFRSALSVAQFLSEPIPHFDRYTEPNSICRKHAYASLIYLELGELVNARHHADLATGASSGDVSKRLTNTIRDRAYAVGG